jgi:hypothetical protein
LNINVSCNVCAHCYTRKLYSCSLKHERVWSYLRTRRSFCPFTSRRVAVCADLSDAKSPFRLSGKRELRPPSISSLCWRSIVVGRPLPLPCWPTLGLSQQRTSRISLNNDNRQKGIGQCLTRHMSDPLSAPEGRHSPLGGYCRGNDPRSSRPTSQRAH